MIPLPLIKFKSRPIQKICHAASGRCRDVDIAEQQQLFKMRGKKDMPKIRTMSLRPSFSMRESCEAA